MNAERQILVSVIIPSYKSDKTIADTVESVTTQQCGFDFEIIVVNSSNDRTADIIRQHFPGVTLIQLPQRTLAAKARNLGAKKAKGRFFAFIDSDCLIKKNWLQMLIDSYSTSYCGVGGPIENANPDTAVSWAGYLLEFSDFFSTTTPMAKKHVASGNLLVHRKTFFEVNGFPENFHFAQEDRLFSWMICKKSGRPFLFHPDIIIFHNHRQGIGEFLHHQYQIGRGGAEILRKTDLPGSELVRHRLLINLLLPLLPFKKLGRCLLRTIRYRPRLLLARPQIILLMLLGQIYWTVGFGERINTTSPTT